METLNILIAFSGGYLIAQTWKFITGVVTGYRAKEIKDLRTLASYFARSGGMPSGHTASLTAATTYMGLFYGFNSPFFAVMLCILAIVTYDATHVRKAVEESTRVLRKMPEGKKLRLYEGHTWLQVIVGAILGVLIGFVVFWIQN